MIQVQRRGRKRLVAPGGAAARYIGRRTNWGVETDAGRSVAMAAEEAGARFGVDAGGAVRLPVSARTAQLQDERAVRHEAGATAGD